MTTLETFRADGSGYWARPSGQLGSVGWSPFPWTITWGATPEQAHANFRKAHAHHEASA